jgi:hypothetical protein
MITALDNGAFPSFERPVRAFWAPILLSPIRGSYEQLVIGVAVVSDAGFHVEAANALSRLQCLYGSSSDIVIQVAGIVLDELRTDLATRSLTALRDFQPSITGVGIGEIREAEGLTLEAIGSSWMGALSSLYDGTLIAPEVTEEDEESSIEARFEAFVSGDRLPRLVLDYVKEQREGFAKFFRTDLVSTHRRRKSHEVQIDFSGSKLVANFGTLQAGQVARSVDLIKRRLWDLKVERDSEGADVFQRRHEMLIQVPAKEDPQVTERQYENLEIAKQALEQQADQEQLRLEAFSSVTEIGNRVLESEESR